MRNAKTIYLGGVPASGKSTLFRRIRGELFSHATAFKHGLCRGVECGPYKMIGVFDGRAFEGTDGLSMCVIDDTLEYVAELERGGRPAVVFVEGDRLFCERFIRETRAEAFILEAYQRVLDQRRRQRASSGCGQTDTFLKSKRTKVDNLRRKLGIRTAWNNTPDDQDRIFNYLVNRARRWIASKTT